MGPLSVTWTDGGLATTLQRRGLPLGTPVEPWLDTRPDLVAQAHRAFVDAGARIVLAATFGALPGVDPRWEAHVDHAVALAQAAAKGHAAVWAALGPGPAGFSGASPEERARRARGWARAGARAVAAGARGIALETFVDPGALGAAARAIREALPDTAVVGCLVPRPDGCLADGTDPRPAVEDLLGAGVAGVGFNCGWGPEGVERALDRCGDVPARWWAKPAAGAAPAEEVVRALVRLADRCTWVGGCCGVGPEVLAEAIARSGPS